MARIGVDLDGVFYDFGAAFRGYLVDHVGLDDASLSPQRDWYFYREWGITDTQFVGYCRDAANARLLWSHNAPDVEDLTHLRRLQKQGHTLHVITDRSFGKHSGISHEATAKWLAEHDFPYDTLTFSRDKTIVTTDYMIDDRIENYDALTETVCTPYLLDRPWNVDRDGYTRNRVSTVGEFADLILNAKKAAA